MSPLRMKKAPQRNSKKFDRPTDTYRFVEIFTTACVQRDT